MSLINDMLRDLEARRAEDLGRANLQGEIRPLPKAPSRAWGLPVLAGIGLVAIGAVAGVIVWRLSVPQPGAPAPIMPPVVDANAPLAGFDPARYELRPALSLSLPVNEAKAPAAVPETKKTEPAQPSRPALPAMPLPKTPSPLPAAASVAAPAVEAPRPAQIERQPVLATPRERADAEYRQALAAQGQGRNGEAQELLRAALRHEAAYSPARQALLRLLLQERRNDEAMAVLAEGLEIQPTQLGWAMSLARLLVDKGDQAAAARTLARSWPHASASADYAGFYGHLQYRLGLAKEAVALYQTATRLAPGEGRWWYGLAVALEADGHGGEARDAFRRALASGNLNADLTALAEQRVK